VNSRLRRCQAPGVQRTTHPTHLDYAIGSAALASFLLFSAYLDEGRSYGVTLVAIDIAKPEVFIGGLFGAMLVFLFAALAISAVGKAAYYVITVARALIRIKQRWWGIQLGIRSKTPPVLRSMW